MDSQVLSTFVPVYDAIPKGWEDASGLLTERLKLHANGINNRVSGYYVDVEQAAGIKFIPGTVNPTEYRSVLRKVVDCSPLVIGANSFAHGITFDANFTLIDLSVAATNSTTLIARPMPNPTTSVTMDVTNIIITSTVAYDRAFATVLYMQEV